MASDPAHVNVDISPELVPIVTLLSAQGHRHYLENNFMLLHDLNNEGQPADRKWTEVYGVLSGIQLAIWDAKTLSNARKLKNKDLSINKPFYLNLGDASFKCMDSLPSTNGKPLTNVISISTTLKNRYILQFKSKEILTKWHSAIRLANFEYVSLQEAYTASLLSSKGAKLSDIRVILAESKYNYQHWISVRFGAGTAWQRCFAVVDLNPKKSKKSHNKFGKIVLYQHDKIKKSPIIAEITSASRAYAAYPNATIAIDSSSLVKIDGKVIFTKSGEKEPRDSSIFIMPEAHAHVPGYDTLIRFLIPTLDAFHLYGRPTKLNADKMDPSSLLFGLPVLPHVHYLELEDAFTLAQANPASMTSWSDLDWFANLKSILKQKMIKGYTGCGSVQGISGALKSPVFGGTGSNTGTPISPNFETTFKDGNNNEYQSIDGNLNKQSANQNSKNPFANSVSAPPVSQPPSNVPKGIPNPGVPNPYGQNPPIKESVDANPYGMAPLSGSGPPPMNGMLPLPSDSSMNGNGPVGGNCPVGGKNQELPLPSDSMNSQMRSVVHQQSQYAMSSSNGSSPPHAQNTNMKRDGLELPLPSDNHKFLQHGTSGNNHPQIAKIQTNYDYNASLMSSSSAIRSAAALKSAAALSETMDRLSIHKEVDDTVFNVSEMLAKASSFSSSDAKKGSTGKKYRGPEIDMFNPAYSEALLSPAVDTNF